MTCRWKLHSDIFAKMQDSLVGNMSDELVMRMLRYACQCISCFEESRKAGGSPEFFIVHSESSIMSDRPIDSLLPPTDEALSS